ncbi:MAG: hypothetical protein ACPG7F_09980 [Aggregatilineales bacterium]
MRYRLIPVCLIFIVLSGLSLAQQRDDIFVLDYEIVPRVDVFGVERLWLTGILQNDSAGTHTNITVDALLEGASGQVMGEAYGFPVNACGESLLDIAVQPGQQIRFDAVIDAYEDDVDPDSVNFEVQSEVIAAENNSRLNDALQEISREEVVALEWLDENTLRYGVGCHRDLFLTYDWYEYTLDTESITPITHPGVDMITEQFIEVTRINLTGRGEYAPEQLERSKMSISPNGNRVIYQTHTNTVMSAEPPGYYRGIVHRSLNQYSLQGIAWTGDNVFLAYYYGAYGDPVHYFTAGATGILRSGILQDNPQSITVPGISPDGLSAVIGTTINDVTGYYLTDISGLRPGTTLLLQSDLPGNNYPAPLVTSQNGQMMTYLMQSINTGMYLRCVKPDGEVSEQFIEIPVNLQTDERAMMRLSPDKSWIVLAATGRQAGLWRIELSQLQSDC